MSCRAFVRHQSIVNLARVDPVIVKSKLFQTKSGASWRLYVDNEPAISVIPGYCIKSSVTETPDKKYKYVCSIPHTQKWDCIVGSLGMGMGHARFLGQVYPDSVSFQTLPTPSKPSSQRDVMNFGFQGIQSAATVASSSTTDFTKTILSCDDEGEHLILFTELKSYLISSACLRCTRCQFRFGRRRRQNSISS